MRSGKIERVARQISSRNLRCHRNTTIHDRSLSVDRRSSPTRRSLSPWTAPLRESEARQKILDDQGKGGLDAKLGGAHMDFRFLGRFVGSIDAGEPTQFAGARLAVEVFRI